MRITRLEAQNIGPFEDLKIDFKEKVIKDKAEIHILTGENGTGKSTVLMMLASCADSDNDLNLTKRFWNVVKFNFKIFTDFKEKTHYSNIDEVFEFDASRLYNSVNLPLQNPKKGGIPSYRLDEVDNRFYDYLNVDGSSKFCFFGYSGYRLTKGDGIVNIREITSNPLENAVNFEKNIDSNLILDWVANVVTKELLAKNKGTKLNDINAVQRIEKALSDITNKKIEFDLEETLKVSVKVNGIPLSFNTLPDGLKSIISWLSDLLMRLDRINWADKSKSILEQNFILFLDEIEVHLHPSWQRKILPVVQNLFPNAQIFISTHSPFVVGSVDGAWVYKFKLDENNNSVLDKEPYLTEDGYSYDRILEETFGITERFGVGVQKQLEEFRTYKNKILAGEDVDNEAFMKLAKEIADQSIELNSIINFELRQIKRMTNQTLETT